MSSAGSPQSYNNNPQTRVAVHRLQELLELLHPDPTPDVFTLNSLQYRYKLHENMNLAAIRDIEQSQRINRALGDYRQSGLNEFHIGLIYLYWGECYAAEKQFEMSRRHWSMDHGQVADLCLSLFGRGYAQGLAHHYETAMVSLGKAGRCLERMPQPTSVQMNFYARMLPYLRGAQELFSEKMRQWPTEDVQRTQTHTASNWNFPDPHDFAEHCLWYEVEVKQDDSFVNIGEETLLLVNGDVANHKYKQNELVVVVKNNVLGGSVSLRPLLSSAPFQRIYLATTQFEGRWTRDVTGRVSLSPELKQIPVYHNEVLGIVVGFWQKIPL